jgi:hypothetical protein
MKNSGARMALTPLTTASKSGFPYGGMENGKSPKKWLQQTARATLIKSTFCRNPKTEKRRVHRLRRLRQMATQIKRILVQKSAPHLRNLRTKIIPHPLLQ